MAKRAWIISVSMGYGHQRAAFPLKELAPDGKVILANDYEGMPEKDKTIWQTSRRLYEAVSQFRKVPLFGDFVFFIFDQFQKIQSFYPKRDLSKPNLQLEQTYALIKKGWGRDLIKKLKEKPLPIVSTFFSPAFMAERFGYPRKIYCLVCDADVSRAWAPLKPKRSKIKYLVPTSRAGERLKLYGVKAENIFLTGFPLPLENIGTKNMEVLKRDLAQRMVKLDPKKQFFNHYEALIKKYLGRLPSKVSRPLTILFAVGGAGAQKEIGVQIVKSLTPRIKRKEVKVILVAGIRQEVRDYFEKKTKGLAVEILFERELGKYFEKFNLALRKTDILWTKPSELSFYSALGLPIIIAPPLGSQEKFNKEWLLQLGAGLSQKNPLLAHEWLFDYLDRGLLAEAALQGFIEAEKLGTINIKKIVLGRRDKSFLPLRPQVSGLGK